VYGPCRLTQINDDDNEITKIPVWATSGHRPHNFLAVGAIVLIAAMDSAPMFCRLHTTLAVNGREVHETAASHLKKSFTGLLFCRIVMSKCN